MRDLGALQRMAKEMQAKMERAQAELAEAVVEGTAGGGAVTVRMTGTQEMRSVSIARDAVDPGDVETLQDLVLAAVKDAIERSKKLANDKLGAATGGMRLPGM
jgi:DNA-binding YbaB/EbfC family protein